METQDAKLVGGPPTFEVTAWCPVKGCPWEHTWAEGTSLGDVMDVVGTHLHEVHS
jgi:hypothetical protein